MVERAAIDRDPALTAELAARLRDWGADLVGVADADDFAEAPPQKRPRAILKDARAVAVFACRIPLGSSTAKPTVSYLQFGYYGLEAFINKLAQRASVWLEDRGYLAAASPAGHDITGLRVDQRGPMPKIELLSTFDLRLAAVKAGLGQIGANNNLITAEYGSRLRLGAVITTAPLVPDEPMTYGVVPAFCKACGFRCVRACPAGALPGDGAVDHYKCMVIHPERVDAAKALATFEKRYGGPPVVLASKMMAFTENAPHACATCIMLCPMDQGVEARRHAVERARLQGVAP